MGAALWLLRFLTISWVRVTQAARLFLLLAFSVPLALKHPRGCGMSKLILEIVHVSYKGRLARNLVSYSPLLSSRSTGSLLPLPDCFFNESNNGYQVGDIGVAPIVWETAILEILVPGWAIRVKTVTKFRKRCDFLSRLIKHHVPSFMILLSVNYKPSRSPRVPLSCSKYHTI